jgi:ankyrin repeat protein
MMKLLQKIKPGNFIHNREGDHTILHLAASEANLEVINQLKELSYFPDITNDITNKGQWTPIMWAS